MQLYLSNPVSNHSTDAALYAAYTNKFILQ